MAVTVFHWLKRCISQLFFQGRRAFAAASCTAVTPKDHISILWKTQHHSWCPAPGGLHPDTGINSKWQLCHAKVYNLDVHGAVGGPPLHNQVWGLSDQFQKSSGGRGLGQPREEVFPPLPSPRFSGGWVAVTLVTPLSWRWQSQTFFHILSVTFALHHIPVMGRLAQSDEQIRVEATGSHHQSNSRPKSDPPDHLVTTIF